VKIRNPFKRDRDRDADLSELEFKIKGRREKHDKNIKKANDFEETVFKALYDDKSVDKELRSLFHRLNYQRVVDDMTHRIKVWKGVLITFTVLIVVGLGLISIYFDHIIPAGHHGVLSEYERMVSAIDLEINWQKHGHAIYTLESDTNKQVMDSTVVELSIDSIRARPGKPELEPLIKATDSFWFTYYLRYMLIRIFISAIIFLFISAAIKVYMRLRRDRMSLIYKEEATTTILYFIEKYLTTPNEKGEKVPSEEDKEKIMQLLPLIANELYHNRDIEGKSGEDYQAITLRLMQMMENIIGLKKGGQ